MSQPLSPQSMSPGQPPPEPKVRLQTWVNVVLVLILLGSCGSAQLSAGQVADQVVERINTGSGVGSGPESNQEDVVDLCRLMGKHLVKGGIDPATVFPSDDSVSRCQLAAQESATR